jgi:bifunctional non-homologous end joining protein LigD
MLSKSLKRAMRPRGASSRRSTPSERPEVSGDTPPKSGGAVRRFVRRMRDRRASPFAQPAFVTPQLATRVSTAPDADSWLHEIKLDGYRLLARIHDGRVTLFTRTGKDWTARMPSLARALRRVHARSALLDGEVVVLDAKGRSDFQLLQNSLHDGKQDRCVYFAFDLLHLDGEDLRNLPLRERKQRLRAVLPGGARGQLRFSEHVIGHGPKFFAEACALHAEGIVSKRAAAPYVSRRDRSWLKIKCVERQEFVIGGFTLPAGARSHLGALLLGTHGPRGELIYAGRVGTGFTQASLAELHEKLQGLVQAEAPFADPPRGGQTIGVRWVRPELVAEIEFAEQTREGLVRHASFRGLRADKPASDVTSERVLQTPHAERRL